MSLFGFHLPSLPVYLRDFEPARLQAIKSQAFILATLLGFNLGTDVDAKASTVVGVLAAVLTWWQAETTRAQVFSPVSAAELAEDMPAGYIEIDDENPPDDAAAFEAAGQDELPE